MCISALRRKVVNQEEKLSYNELESSIVAISPLTTKMKMLYPYEHCDQFKAFKTCQIETGLFQLSANSSCRILIADFKTRKFTIEQRRPIPFAADWVQATMVALPDSKVMVFGRIWDQNNLTPWVYDLNQNSWSNKLTPDG